MIRYFVSYYYNSFNMSGRGPHSDQDQEDSMSDIESNEEVARLGMLNIASSPDEAPMASLYDPSSPHHKHSLVSGPVTRSQAKKVPDKRSKSSSPRRLPPRVQYGYQKNSK